MQISESKQNLLFPILIAVAVFVSFGSTLNGTFLWDDTYVIQKNLFIRDLSNIPDLLTSEYFAPSGIGHYTRSGEESYRPAVTLTYMLDYAVYRMNAKGYHLSNLLLHLLACLAFARLLRALTGEPRISLFGGLLFAVHPLNSETINMISYREDLLAGLFVCLALFAFVRGRGFIASLFYLCALLSKEMALVVMPLSLLHILLIRKDRAERVRIIYFFAIITIAYLILIFGVFPSPTSYHAHYPGGNFINGMATMSRVVVRYVQQAAIPVNLAVDPWFPPSHSFSEPRVLLSTSAILILLGVPFFFRFPGVLSFLYLWFFLALTPVSGVFPLTNYVAERYLYIPLMGFCGTIGFLLIRVMDRWKATKFPLIALFSIIIAVSAGMDIKRAEIWRDPIDFFTEMIRANPNSAKGQSSLGLALYRKGDRKQAQKCLIAAIRLDPDNNIARHNLACLYLEEKQDDRAEKLFREVIHRDPGFTESVYQLASLLNDKGLTQQAETYLKKALKLNPRFIPAQFLLGSIYQSEKKYDSAIRIYKKIIKADPTYHKALKNLGIIYYYIKKQPIQAALYFRKYLELVPDDPQRNLIWKIITTK